ncbi:MAG: class I SAM-dependent methyltransferase [Rubripirellula sp.]
MTRTKLDEDYQATYDDEATSYDKSRFGSTRGEFAMRYKNDLAISLLQRFGALHPESRILDCPSGTGRITHALKDSQFGKINAVDISPEMLSVNEKNLPFDKARVEFGVANMKELPFNDNTFDGVVMASFFYLVPMDEYQQYLADIFRVVKPGGVVVVEFSNALPACNPRNLAYAINHKYIGRNKVKSYVPPWAIRGLMKPFSVKAIRGTEYPLIGGSYGFYRKTCNLLGFAPPTRWISGKYTVAACKPS